MQRQQPFHRVRSHVSTSTNKRIVTGNTAGIVAPAWKSSYAAHTANIRRQADGDTIPRRREIRKTQTGSKILMSQLPTDSVEENDIEELFRETIGPVFNVFAIYNSQGKSKGMAVVHFQRPGDAIEARRRYNGKIIDGRRPLKIELIVDPPEVVARASVALKEKTLADRLSGPINNESSALVSKTYVSVLVPSPPSDRRQVFLYSESHVYSYNDEYHQTQRRGVKKGPRRLKKSAEQLDKDMEVYMAQSPRLPSDIMAMS
ncbi:hypothetical protein BU17DRAFT_63371 [Hysterangium stoloniferum]|nr:hypothetical protein BU17DRAFT_63371 [Hysterangium stoloniferum]